MTKISPETRKLLIGTRFFRLEIKSYTGKEDWYWCLCDCGIGVKTRLSAMKVGYNKSCGCYNAELQAARKTHGLSDSSEYKSWTAMRLRCLSPTDHAYRDYGGRGITVCDRWKDSFENFLMDMGPKKSKAYSIDRIDNNGNYEPSNCRWATQKEQCNNRRSCRYFEINGETKTITEWCEVYSKSYALITSALYRGKDIIKILTS